MRRGRREEGMGGERRKKQGEREGRKGTEEGPTKNSCRGAQNVKLRHCTALKAKAKIKNVRKCHSSHL